MKAAPARFSASTLRTGAILSLALVTMGAISAPAVAAPSSASQYAASARGAGQQSHSQKAAVRELDADIASASTYMRTTPEGNAYFDTSTALEENADPSVLEMGAYINTMAATPAPAGMASAAALSIPIHGNWCGPGHGGGTPVDVLDSLCRTHDQCYDSQGYFACSCDRQLVRGIRDNAYRMGSQERTIAAAVSVYFTYSLCNPFK